MIEINNSLSCISLDERMISWHNKCFIVSENKKLGIWRPKDEIYDNNKKQTGKCNGSAS
jgi:hypothetical protein